MIRFQCPQCHHNYTLEDSFAGKKVQCAYCSLKMIIPEQLPQIETLPLNNASAPAQEKPKVVKKSSLRSAFTVLFFLFLLAGGGFYFVMHYPPKTPSNGSDLTYTPATHLPGESLALTPNTPSNPSAKNTAKPVKTPSPEMVKMAAQFNASDYKTTFSALQENLAAWRSSEAVKTASLYFNGAIVPCAPNVYALLGTPNGLTGAAVAIPKTGGRTLYAAFDPQSERPPEGTIAALLHALTPKMTRPIIGVYQAPAITAALKVHDKNLNIRDVTDLAKAGDFDILMLNNSTETFAADLEAARKKGLHIVYFLRDNCTFPLGAERGILYQPDLAGSSAVQAAVSPYNNLYFTLCELCAAPNWNPESAPERTIVNNTLMRALDVLPQADTAILPLYRTVIADLPEFNTLTEPMRLTEKIKVAYYDAQLKNAARSKQFPHPAAARFPGLIGPNATLYDADVILDLSIPYWQTTHFYAPPGEVVSIEIPQELTEMGLSVQIGMQTRVLDLNETWERAPSIARSAPLTERVTEIVNPYGGIIYIVVPPRKNQSRPAAGALRKRAESTKPDYVGITLQNVVEMPVYALNSATAATKTELERAYRAKELPPMMEIDCGNVILTLPTPEAVEAIAQPAKVAQMWNNVLKMHKIGEKDKLAFPIRISVDALANDAEATNDVYPIIVPLRDVKMLYDPEASAQGSFSSVTGAIDKLLR